MEIAPGVLEQIGEVLTSGSLDPDTAVADIEGFGVCGLDWLDTWMAIEASVFKLSADVQEQLSAEYDKWTVGLIASYWDSIIQVLQHQNQKE